MATVQTMQIGPFQGDAISRGMQWTAAYRQLVAAGAMFHKDQKYTRIQAEQWGGVAVVLWPPEAGQEYIYAAVRPGMGYGGGAGGNSLGTSGGAGGAGGTPQGATNAATRQAQGGADIGRGASTAAGTGADVRTEFTGINSYPPDTQILPQQAKFADNVDSITRRGALGKRPGVIHTYPQRSDIVNGVAVIDAALDGRSINALPAGFLQTGNTCLLLGYDSRTDLGKGNSSASSKRIRAVPVYPLWHAQKNITNVKPLLSAITTTAAAMAFSLTLPTPYKKDSGGTRLASVDQLIVSVSTLGYQYDRDNEDSLSSAYLKDYTAWDGNTVAVPDVGTAGTRRYYTVWFANKRHFSKPYTFTLMPT